MIRYKKAKQTGNLLGDLFATWYNRNLMRRLVTKVAWNQHLTTGREVHVSELFGFFAVFDSREKADINRSGRVGRMETIDLAKASIWNSTAHRASLGKRARRLVHELPRKEPKQQEIPYPNSVPK